VVFDIFVLILSDQWCDFKKVAIWNWYQKICLIQKYKNYRTHFQIAIVDFPFVESGLYISKDQNQLHQ